MQEFDISWILLVEDEEELRALMKAAILKKADLMGINAHIVEAVNGAEALSKAGARAFSCIVTDLKMPKMTGEEAIRVIQNQPLNSNTPIIVISAYVKDEFQNFCSTYEHIRYLPKPCSMDEVSTAVVAEIKYGRRDERVSLHLINPFLKAVDSYLQSNSEKIIKTHAAEIIKPETQIEGEIHCFITIGSDISKACFSISFDNAALMSKDSTKKDVLLSILQVYKLGEVAKEATLSLIEHAMPSLKVCLGGNPHLLSLHLLSESDKDRFNFDEFKRAKKVSIAIESTKGKIILSALSKKDFASFKHTLSA